MRPETTTNIQSDLQKIDGLQNIFDNSLGIKNPPRKLYNYNPVLARWKFEQVKTDEEKRRFKKYEAFQVETALRERNHSAKNSVNYLIGTDGAVYNELFPDEPFLKVLERGLAYRQRSGSKELVREQKEVDGWKKILVHLINPATLLGTKAVVVSGPGTDPQTNYRDNFVDIYELRGGSGSKKRLIKMTRYSTSLSWNQYFDRIKALNGDYFQETNLPIDAWFLSHPIFIDPTSDQRSADEIFNQVFEFRKGFMPEDDFQKLLITCMPVINYYIDSLCQSNFDPGNIALSWNAVLAKNDLRHQPVFQNLDQEIYWLGRQVIRTVAGGCGSSSGFKLGESSIPPNSLEKYLANSVGKYGLKNKEWFVCPSCDYHADGPVGEQCPSCGMTKEKYATKGGKVC